MANRLHRIRIIQQGKTITHGLSIPKELVDKWAGVFVSVVESGNSLILESGALPMKFGLRDIRKDIQIIDKVKI